MLDFLSSSNLPALLSHYGYAVYFPLTIAEGPIVAIIAGLFVSLGYFNFSIVYILALLGDLAGDVIYYFIGRWGGERILKKGKFLGIKTANLEKLKNYFTKHVGKTLLFGKWTQSVGAPILIAAGMAGVPMGKYLFFNILGSIPKVLAFITVGYYFGQAYVQIGKYLEYGMFSLFIAVALSVLIYWFAKKFKNKVEED
ncbi:DedA family protein [bacterium]|nr:MAG: DedA family protein [bacterium]